jgi:epoxyqueuosine reductase
LAAALRTAAGELGFLWGGVAPAIESAGFSQLVDWIAAGYAAQMSYFADRLDAYRHPSHVLEGVRSIIVLALPYAADGDGDSDHDSHARIARYARDPVDYHDRVHPRLKHLCRLITAAVPTSRSRGVVDTAPLMEREIAQLAGFGWRGKNTLLLNKQYGSYFFLACVLTDVALPSDAPHTASHCGTCTACLDACPTNAFPQPGVLDASRCISYLTIEHRDPIPIELRAGIGEWLFGCDVCQEVCPWNRRRVRNHDQVKTAAADSIGDLDPSGLLRLSESEFRTRFRNTPLWRPRRRGLLRNAAIVLGNRKDPACLDALQIGLWDPEPIVRGAAAWAIGQCAIGQCATKQAQRLLNDRLNVEDDPAVQAEIRQGRQQL